MAAIPTALARTAASTTISGLYTVSSGTAIVTNIIAANATASGQTFSLYFGGVAVVTSGALSANSTTFFDLKQVLASGTTISGYASSTGVTFHISGVQLY